MPLTFEELEDYRNEFAYRIQLGVQDGTTRTWEFANDIYLFCNINAAGAAIPYAGNSRNFVRRLKSFSLKIEQELLTENGVVPGPFITFSADPSEVNLLDDLKAGAFIDLILRFVDPDMRQQFSTDPESCFKALAELFGNKYSEVPAYSLLAELQLAEMLMQHGKLTDVNAQWLGVEGNVHDFELDTCSIEVKSTKNRADELVVSSQYQLRKTNNKPLYVAFFKYEFTGNESIETVMNNHAPNTPEYTALMAKLSEKGIEPGDIQWQQKFHQIQDVRFYEVDANFPKITENDFITGQFPIGIDKIVYHVNLNNINYITLTELLQRI